MSRFRLVSGLCLLTLSGLVSLTLPAEDSPKSRQFQFTYQVKLTGLHPGQNYRMWLPIPPSNEFQTATLASRENLNTGKITKESRFGNQMLYLEGPANEQGEADAVQTFSVTRREVASTGSAPSAEEMALFLQPDKLVPVQGKPQTLIEGKQLPQDKLELGRVLYDTVNTHMKYSKEGTGWGRGDAEWACDSRFGNCSDFHSLFISLARSQRMPAKFEIGFPLPEARGSGEIPGYHCWAFFQPESAKGWFPVDISEANKNPKMANYYFGHLTENRIALTTGRDVTLEPAQAGPPLNFFVYPYAEVEGKPWPAEKIKKSFKYRDLSSN
jgi:transglutaminase-like putative cysteine protease